MPTTNFPFGVSSYGMPLVGSGPVLTVGNVFFVSSVATGRADHTSNGKDPATPFATLDYAIGQCTASNNDVIFVMPGHVETIATAAAVAVDVAGISIIGMGTGSLRPKMNVTGTSGSFKITAANVLVQNILFTGGVDATTNPVHLAAADITLLDCETRDVTGQSTDFIVTTAACDRLRISRWKHRGAAAAGADTAISIVGGANIVIEDFWIAGNFAVAAIENVTTAATEITIGGGTGMNFIWTQNAADVAVTLAATTTGFVGPNIYAQLTDNAANITEAFVGAAAVFFQPISIVNLAGESSMFTNITASTDA